MRDPAVFLSSIGCVVLFAFAFYLLLTGAPA